MRLAKSAESDEWREFTNPGVLPPDTLDDKIGARFPREYPYVEIAGKDEVMSHRKELPKPSSRLDDPLDRTTRGYFSQGAVLKMRRRSLNR
jgi:hypothetical protein